MAVPKGQRSRPGSRDQGAAAVEFALVMPLFFMLIMGITNYGLWFSDSLQLRQGVRESARQAVVLTTFSGADCPGTGMKYVACRTKKQTVMTGGVASVKIFTPNGKWKRGEQVVVCAMVQSVNFTGFVPLPAGGLIKSMTTMSIENVASTPSPIDYEDTPPTGKDWAWCTA